MTLHPRALVPLLACLCRLGPHQWKIRVREDRARVRTCGRCGIQQRRRFNDLVPGSPHWWEPLVIVLACLVAAPCHAGEIAYDLSPPTASDSASCGAMDTPLTDFDHYLVHLYRCIQDSIVYRPPLKPIFIPRQRVLAFTLPADTDSVRFTVADGIQGWTQVWAVDQSGNRSCGYLSDTWVTKAVAAPAVPPPDTTGGIQGRYFAGTSRGGQPLMQRTDGPLDWSWGLGSPAPEVPVDQWSAEWIGSIVIPTTGSYTFYVKSEDGCMLNVNGTMGIMKWGIQPVTEWNYTVNLTAGVKPFAIYYMANNGNSELHVSISGPGISKRPIPRSWLR